jgi:drug/metabolite transporter (DMT)-like permease
MYGLNNDRIVRLTLVTLPLVGGAGVFIVGQVTVAEVTPVLVAWLRFAGASLVLVTLYSLGVVQWSLRRQDAGLILLMAVAGTVGYNLALLNGLRLAPAADAGLLSLAEPPLQVLLARVFLRERLTTRSYQGLLLSAIGLMMVVGVAGGRFSTVRLSGDLLLLAATACWPVYTILSRRSAGTVPAVTAVFASTLVGAAGLLPVVVLRGELMHVLALPKNAWLGIAYLAIPGTVGNWTAYYWAVSQVGAAAAAPYANLVPVWTLAIAIPVLHEVPSLGQLIGAGLALAGVWLAGNCAQT